MNRTSNIDEAEDNVSNNFRHEKVPIPRRNIHFRIKPRKHFTRYMSVCLILSNGVICPSTSKIRPKITFYALSASYETG